MALEVLPDDESAVAPDTLTGPGAGPDHPMRVVTREVAFEHGWSSGRARKVAELFDGLAAEWSASRSGPERVAPVADAIARGGVDVGGRWLELGSGTGAGTRVLRGSVERVVAADLSAEMLANAPADLAPRIRADASCLPFRADQFDGVLMVNMLLFPDEVDRILAPAGRLLWVNSLGERTPIHLSPEDLLEALPGSWSGVTARSGSGFWASAHRGR